MKHLARYAARLAAGLVVLAVMIGPVVGVAAIAGNPFPADLLTRISARNVDDETIIKLLSLLFYVCWAWFCLPALRQLISGRHSRPHAGPVSQRPATGAPATPVVVSGPVVAPTRGPRAGLARLARFAVSSAAVVSSLTGVAGVANASSSVRPAAVAAAVVAAPSDPAAAVEMPGAVTDAASTIVASHRDTPYAIATRHFPADQLDAARDEILALNVGRALPDGTTYRGGGFPAGWDVIVPAAALPAVTAAVAEAESTVEPASGHVVVADESYWSISEAQLTVELGREPTGREVFERTEAAIAYNAPRLGYDDPKMLHPGDVVYVDAATLSVAASTRAADAAGGHVVVADESYWSISEAQLTVELGREPTGREVFERTEAAIAYNAPRLGYDDPKMLHPGDVVFVDAATLSGGAAAPAPPESTPESPVTPAATDPAAADQPPVVVPPTVAVPTVTLPASVDADVDTEAPIAPTTTSPTPETAPTPVTTAPRVTQEVTAVEQDDMLSSRWLFGGVAVTSLGLVGAWITVKQMRRRRRRWLGLPVAQGVGTAPTERERAAQLDVEMLRAFVAPDRLSSTGACAVLLGARPEIRFRVPTPPPPDGWELVGDAWRRNDEEQMTAAPVLSPALVTIGHGTDEGVSDVVLDLLSAGTVSVTGDRVAVERLMCSMLWELASGPLGDDQVELHVVGLACASAQHSTNAARLVSLDEAIDVAQTLHPSPRQVFLVDPFADDTAKGSLRTLVEACAPGSGRAVVVAGPCERPVEEISVPSEHRAMWDDLTLIPPQLPESVDVELGRMLDSIEVGRRPMRSSSLAVTPDPEAEALALRSTVLLEVDDGSDGGGDEADEPPPASGDDPAEVEPAEVEPAVVGGAVEVPSVVLSVCGREVAVQGYPSSQQIAVLFVLAATPDREMRAGDVAELTGYAVNSLASVWTTGHDLVERKSGVLRLADHVWTDHAWATRCVAQLAEALSVDADAPDALGWASAALQALQALEQGPYAVLPAGRTRARSKGSAWDWVDEFPADAPARGAAETEVAEAALALSELWLAAPGLHRVVHADQMLSELCRLALTIPFAHVGRQLRSSVWVSGAECLLTAGARVAGPDAAMLGRVQQTARALVARKQLEGSEALADELGL